MPARVDPKLTAKWREKIKTSMLINRLQDFAFGKVEMSGDQMRAALGLIKKNLPDLTENDQNVQGNVKLLIDTGVKRAGD